MTFDPTNNDRLDSTADVHAAYTDDQILEQAGLKNRIFFEERGISGQWWFQDVQNRWCGFSQQMAASYLKKHRINPATDNKAGKTMSDLERVMLHIATNYRVAYAGPIAGQRGGIQQNNGQRVLVTREANLPNPVQGDFSAIYELLQRQFGQGPKDGPLNEGPNQLPYLLGWWKHSLECLQNPRTDHRGIAMVLAGEAESGKSLTKDLISMSLGGRECKPYRFMTGQENFNGEFIGSELWVVDDEQSQTDHKSRSEFGANIKKTVADRLYRIRGMMRDGVVLDMYRRLLICVNREPERLMVLPQLDDDIADKLTVLLSHKHPFPATAAEKTDMWQQLVDELPAFIWWLLNDYEIEPELCGRFGIKHFHHPQLCSDLFQMSRERALWEQIQRTLKFSATNWFWYGNSTELLGRMSGESSPLSKREINSLPAPQWVGKALTKIAKEYPEHCIQKKVQGISKWFFCADDRDVNLAVDLVRKNRGQVGQVAGQVEFENEETEEL